MVVREKVTLAVLMALVVCGVWFGRIVWSRGLETDLGGEMLMVLLAFIAVTAISAALLALIGRKGRQVDERDGRVALRAQSLRGFLYLALAFGVLGLAIGQGQHAFANGMLLAILLIEVVSGLVMFALYRRNA
jgi:Kef-type K+ transport system membrane component KefB